MEKNIVILGGGTAGFLTALFMQKILPSSFYKKPYNVKLVRSQEIGIVGVGEATTPQFVTLLRNLGIDIFDCIKKTNASIKNGIKFVNWNGDDLSYFHSFHEWLVDHSVPGIFGSEARDYYIKNLIDRQLPFEDHIYAELLSSKNHIDLDKTAWSLHFDAGLMAKYLEEVAEKRGISIIDEIYDTCETDYEGNICKLNFRSGNSIGCKFVFDCTGFHRSLIGNHFKEKWISYEKYLPMNKAIPFWLDSEDDIEPYTTSTALKNGWMWKIPLTSRIGCGYIFDNNYISVDEAKKEVEDYLGREIQVRKVLDFKPGRFENVWVKNCMAVGLSSQFLEPIESTSLWVTITQLNLFAHYLNDIESSDEISREIFNSKVATGIDGCMYFVYLHYVTKRNDSEFWREFKKKHPIPEVLQRRLNLLKNNKLKFCDLGEGEKTISFFSLSSYLQVANGLGLTGPDENSFYKPSPTPEEYKNIILNNFRYSSYPNKKFLDDVNNSTNNVGSIRPI